jgi:hypothetical protein
MASTYFSTHMFLYYLICIIKMYIQTLVYEDKHHSCHTLENQQQSLPKYLVLA